MSCPGELLSALVDGELGHDARERVLSHLLACDVCRLELEELRAVKSRLSWSTLETPVPGDALTARLLGLAVPGVEPLLPRASATTGSSRPVSVRPAARAAGASRPRPRARLRRRMVGGYLVAIGLGAAFVLGGPTRDGDVQVDPGTDSFVADFVNSTNEVPMTEPVDASVVGIVP